MKSTLMLFFYFCSIGLIFCQNQNSLESSTAQNFWSDISEKSISIDKKMRQIVPQKYRTVTLDFALMDEHVRTAPLWMTEEANRESVEINLPMPDGTNDRFRVYYAPVMHPDLAARYPNIRSYAGQGIDDPTASIRFDMTPKGFHAMVLSGRHNAVFIDPYAKGNTEHYVSYYKKDYQTDDKWACGFDELDSNFTEEVELEEVALRAGDCSLRTYRLALACTGEYAAFHGGTVDGAMAAFTTSMTRVNGVYEREISVTMVMVANNDELIFLDADTDPYTNNSGGTMLGQNQTTCDNVIGSANYDIGHVFSTGGGGVASLFSPCGSGKARGVTGRGAPVGDPFDIDYVAHEIGHQFGGRHTQNNSCNRDESYEPGSASTIMGYAGICSPNVQNNSDPYFHVKSIMEMAGFITSPNHCAVISDNNNNAPTADAGSNHVIPRSTPFVLTGVGTDPDDNPLTYCWEQFDKEVAPMPPASTNTAGPAFRSLLPSDSPERYFPNLPAVISNTTPTWEVLPSVARTMNFQLTVRDNHMGSGCTAEDMITLEVNGTAGPFLVLSPNTNVSWPSTSEQTVTWDVANTNATGVGEVNCQSVDILLSTDGGNTYPITLAAGVSNDGSHTITVPENITTTARVRIQCATNVFFDISDTDFEIYTGVADYLISTQENEKEICAGPDVQYSIETQSILGYNDPVTFSVNGLTAGLSTNFSTNPVTPGETVTLTIGNTGTVGAIDDDFTIEATSTSGSKNIALNLKIKDGVPAAVVQNMPAADETDVVTSPTFEWVADPNVSSYDFKLSTDMNFNSIVEEVADYQNNTLQLNMSLESNTTYYWQVEANNICGASPPVSRSFSTISVSCFTYTNDTDVAISDSGTPTETSTIEIPVNGILLDVNVLNLEGTHTYIRDLRFTLSSPNNTDVILLNRVCGSQNNFDISFDDSSNNTYDDIPCPPTDGQTYQPSESLSAFNNGEVNGEWVLSVQDVADQDGGVLDTWTLEVCVGNAVLPIELLDFEAVALENAIQLDWATATETENAGFEVLRSTEASRGFEKIAWIVGKGNSQEKQVYEMLDKQVQANVRYYYQLRQIDHNGRSTLSNIVEAMILSNETTIMVHPNPSNGLLLIQTTDTFQETLSIQVFNSLGEWIRTRKINSGQQSSVELDIQDLSEGVYFLRIEQDGDMVTKRIIIQ